PARCCLRPPSRSRWPAQQLSRRRRARTRSRTSTSAAARRACGGGGGRRTADERLDLFVVTPGAVKIWELTESGYAAAPSEIVRLPDEPCLIDYGDVAGGPGDEIV